MEAEEVAERLEVLAQAGMTAEEVSVGFNKINKLIYEVTVEDIKELAKHKDISYERAEMIYMQRLSRLSGKRGKLFQQMALNKVRKIGKINY